MLKFSWWLYLLGAVLTVLYIVLPIGADGRREWAEMREDFAVSFFSTVCLILISGAVWPVFLLFAALDAGSPED